MSIKNTNEKPNEKTIGKYCEIHDKLRDQRYRFHTDITIGEMWSLGSRPQIKDQKNITPEERVLLNQYNSEMLCKFSADPKLVREMPLEGDKKPGLDYKLITDIPSIVYTQAIVKVWKLYKQQQQMFIGKPGTQPAKKKTDFLANPPTKTIDSNSPTES